MKYLAFLLPLIATPAAAADQMTILLDWFVNPDHGPIIVAQQQGFFAAEGLEVTIQPPADPADPPKLLAAGQADLAVSYQPQLHLLVAEGMPVKRVGTLIDNPLNCLLVLADGPVKQIADLKGRKIGFSVGGVEDAVLGSILTGAGLSLDDVELVNVNWSLSPALMAGQVDAVIGAYRNFELNQMLIEGRPGHCFAVEEVGVPIYDELIYLANPATMDAGRTARFLRATAKAAALIAADPQARIGAPGGGTEEKLALEAGVPRDRVIVVPDGQSGVKMLQDGRIDVYSLRQPLETGHIRISRAAMQSEFPARFQLVAAMNPCPCGFLGHPSRPCRCTPEQVARYQGRLSGPLLDRIDLQVEVPALDGEELLQGPPGEGTAAVRERVLLARDRALARQGLPNQQLDGRRLDDHLAAEPAALTFLQGVARRLGWSARSLHRCLRVARTVADLQGADRVTTADVAEAVQYRRVLQTGS